MAGDTSNYGQHSQRYTYRTKEEDNNKKNRRYTGHPGTKKKHHNHRFKRAIPNNIINLSRYNLNKA